ncbi:hypothetical protein ABTC33_16060 [Acinetobacter baumannii]|uniref:hypothetical protein n=1 Tax=Acinetobacter baumannii TaxID=470 RepID=UPI001DE854D4|nr:hypothetical protein [Acinetobacter baumannii]MDC4732048.1 hypothetical protein [Acinetobacter baumannii]HAV5348160.1 hypothetical protein [Acinetobacter baumannii]HEE5402554.1 hypothetical protein [Acinetobacter baumannii]
MLQPESLVIIVENHEQNALLKELKGKSKDQQNIQIIAIPERGPQASLILVATSLVIVAFTEGFFSKLGEMAAEKVIEIFKSIKSSQKEPILISNSPLKTDDKGFSLHHAFYRDAHDGKKIKFLFKKDWSMEEFNSACILMMKELRLYEKNEPNQIEPLLQSIKPVTGIYLLSIQLEDETIYSVDI